MFPLLKDNRDSFKLEKITSKPKKKDIVLYKRDNGQYVLHRIIKEKDNEISFLKSKINSLKNTMEYWKDKFHDYVLSFPLLH